MNRRSGNSFLMNKSKIFGIHDNMFVATQLLDISTPVVHVVTA